MSLFAVNKNPSDAKLREFGWAMVGGFFVLGAIAWALPALKAWWGSTPEPWALLGFIGSPRQWLAIGLWALGLVLFVLAHCPRAVARQTYVVWMSMVTPLGFLMTTLLLTLMFVILLPVFALIRLSDPLKKQLQQDADASYWEDTKPHEASLDRLRRPF